MKGLKNEPFFISIHQSQLLSSLRGAIETRQSPDLSICLNTRKQLTPHKPQSRFVRFIFKHPSKTSHESNKTITSPAPQNFMRH